MGDRVDELLQRYADEKHLDNAIDRGSLTTNAVDEALKRFKQESMPTPGEDIIPRESPLLPTVDLGKIKTAETLSTALGMPPELTYDYQEDTVESFKTHIKDLLESDSISDFFRQSGERMIERMEGGNHRDFYSNAQMFVKDVGKAWHNGRIQEQVWPLNYELAFRESRGEDVTELENKIKALEADYDNLIEMKLDDPGVVGKVLNPKNWVLSAVQMTPMMLNVFKESVPYIFSGMAAGGLSAFALGNAAGVTLAMPEEIGTVPAGMIAGGKVGQMSGSFIASSKRGLAETYADIREIKDGNGERINPKIAFGISAGIAPFYGALEAVQLGKVLKTVPGLNKVFGESLEQAVETVVKRTSSHVIMRGAAEYGKFIGTETMTEIGQEFSVVFAGEFSKLLNNHIEGTKFESTEAWQIAKRLIETGLNSAGAFVVMGGAGHVTGTVSSVKKQNIVNRWLDKAKEAGFTVSTEQMIKNFQTVVNEEASKIDEQPGRDEEVTPTINDMFGEQPDEESEQVMPEEVNAGADVLVEQEQEVIRELEEEKKTYAQAFLEEGETDDYVEQIDEYIEAHRQNIEYFQDKKFEPIDPEGLSYGEQQEIVMRNAPDTEEKLMAMLPVLYSNHVGGLSKDWYWAADRAAGPRAGRGGVSDALMNKLLKQVRNNPRKFAEIFAGINRDEEALMAIQAQGRTDAVVEGDFAEAGRRKAELEQSAARVDEMLARIDLAKEATDKAERARILTGKETLNDIQNAVYQTSKKSFSAGRKVGQEEIRQQTRARDFAKRQRGKFRALKNKVKGRIKKLEGRNLHPEIKAALEPIVNAIDLKQRPKQAMADTKALLQAVKESEETIEIPPDMIENLEAIDKKNIYDMTYDELAYLDTVLKHLEKAQAEKNRVRIGEQQMRKEEAIHTILELEFKQKAEIEGEVIDATDVKQSKKGILNNLFGIGQINYDLLAELLTGRDSVFYDLFFKQVKVGVTTELSTKHELINIFSGELASRLGAELDSRGRPNWSDTDIGNIIKWREEKVPITVFVNGKQKTANISRAQRIDLYMNTRNPNNLESLVKKGFGIKHHKDLGKRPVQFGPDEQTARANIQGIVENMDDTEKLYGEIFDPISERSYELANEVFLEKNGFEIEKVPGKYYPKEVMPEAYDSTQEMEDARREFGEKFQRVGLEKGFTQARTGNPTPIYIEEFDKRVARHIRDISSYVGLEIPLTEVGKVLYNPGFKAEMESRYNDETWKYFEKGLKDIAGNRHAYDDIEAGIMKLKNNVSTAVLGFNPWVMVKQIFSFGMFTGYVKGSYLLRGFMDTVKDHKQVMDTHETFSPEFYDRRNTTGVRDVAEVLAESEDRRLYGGKKNFKEIAMSGIQFFDVNTVASGMQGAVLQVLDEIKNDQLSPEIQQVIGMTAQELQELDPADRLVEAYKYADYAVQRSQPMFRPEHRTQLSRGKPVVRLFTMFSGFTSQALNLSVRSIAEVAREGTGKGQGAKMAKSLFATLVIAPLGAAAVNALRNKMYGRDDEEFFEDMLKQWPEQISGYMLIVRDVIGAIIAQRRYGIRGGGFDSPVENIAQKFVLAVNDYIDAVQKQDAKYLGRAADNTAEFVSMALGYPYPAVSGIIQGLLENRGKNNEQPMYRR